MFQTKSARKPNAPATVETVLSNQIRLEGRLHSTSNIRFDGDMTGDLSTDGDLIVAEHGKVKGNVTGGNVIVAGTIHGNVQTAGRLEILSTGRVFGDISVGALIIDEGGILKGRSAVHAGEAAAESSAAARLSTEAA